MNQPHRSRNTMFWRRDERVVEASRHSGWAAFHRACGESGLFFDDIDPVGRGYGAVTFRIEENARKILIRYVVAEGRGSGPIEAVLDAYRNSVAAGFNVPADLSRLLDSSAAEQTPAEIDDVLGLIG